MDELRSLSTLVARELSLQKFCESLSCICAELWHCDRDRLVQVRREVWFGKNCPVAAIRHLQQAAERPLDAGSSGQARATCKPQLVRAIDGETDSSASQLTRLAEAELELSIPIIGDTTVDAVCTLYYDRHLNTQELAEAVVIVIQQLARKNIQPPSNPNAAVCPSPSFFDGFLGIYRTSSGGKFISANAVLARMLGYNSPEQLLDTITEIEQLFVSPDRRCEFIRTISRDDVVRRFEAELYCRDGSTIWACENARAIRDGNGALKGFEGAIEDITARKRDRETIEYMAYYDALTGLANRVLFQDRLTQAISRAHQTHSKLAVLFIDLDRFKTINDSLGHGTGDELLKEVGVRLTDCVGEGDILARWGGDEFTLMLSQSQAAEPVVEKVQSILRAFETQLPCEGHDFHITCSIGIALYPEDGTCTQTLLQNADAALHRAKDLGRNNAQFFSTTMNVKASNRLYLENDLRRAVQNRELELFYQPQIELQTGRIVSLEALLRWHHPSVGLLSPGQFIPIAEETSLITEMTEWILQTACTQLRAWLKQGLELDRIAVNLSAREFQQAQLIPLASQVLQETGLPPKCLELEITESVAMQDASRTIRTLAELRAMGIQISIDDFGTGYSSIGYLRQFPCDSLKIDRSFICDIGTCESADLIGRSAIDLGRGLGLKVVAEGVETQQQLDFLKAAHCDLGQGFWFSEPLPSVGIEAFLTARAQPQT
ncbi:bifunctional diguanylate cyclase/phosphodiesterase [Synechococcus sp. PCC 7336]|uniref:putative bifunctional diguanylate cyclase/phosphodiesterase n=1 Tax=Synechococcus sp. PCC 7336 TaxID=195250 RepID=UPI000349B1C5|nr:GGDEF and EAL domain-containing protein [Synechococcus sp. PCC 7336]